MNTASALTLFSLLFPRVIIRKIWRTAALIYFPTILLTVAALNTDLFVVEMHVTNTGGIHEMVRTIGPLYIRAYLPLFAIYMLTPLAVFSYQYRKSPLRVMKKQLVYAAIATVGAGSITSLTCMILPLMGVNALYHLGPPVAVAVFVLLMGYAIVSLKAMDIDQLVSRTVLWLISLSFVTLPVASFVYVILENSADFSTLSGTVFMLAGIGLILLYLKYVQPRFDQILQRKVHDYGRILDRFSRELLKLTSLDHLTERILVTLEETIYPAHISILLKTDRPLIYQVFASRNYQGEHFLEVTEKQERAVTAYPMLLEREQLEFDPKFAQFRELANRYFERFQAEIVIPIIFERSLIGAINIGPRSARNYKRIEVDYLERLMGAVNVAFSNSMLLRQIEAVNIAYERFVPKQFLSFLGRHSIVDVQLGDHIERRMTVLFADIRSFTTMSESMTPGENFQFLNAYLSRVGPVVRRNNGFIDKYIGDAIMALFPDSVEDAVHGAVELQEELRRYNSFRGRTHRGAIKIGIGLHTGDLMLGTIGEEKRMEGTVLSDSVNLASRVEGLTKELGAQLLVTQSVIAGLESPDGCKYRFMGSTRVKGKRAEVEIYEILDGLTKDRVEAVMRTRKQFEEAVRLMDVKRFFDACQGFEKVVAADPMDVPAQRLAERCRCSCQADLAG